MAERVNLVETNFFGMGALDMLPEELKKRGLKKTLIVTDDFLYKAGVANQIGTLLESVDIVYSIYTGVKPNPTVDIINECLDYAKQMGVDFLIALGGGSAIDTAKATGILLTNGGNIQDYEGVNKTTYPSAPLVAVNTTAGTGSEVTSFYVVTDTQTHSKMVMVDTNCMVKIAINDTKLMLSMPKGLTACTGMDAMTHAIEAVLSKNATPFTDKDALWAISTIKTFLPRAVIEGKDEEARTMMAYAEYAAGIAFSNGGLGMVHAMAHALGGFYNLPHGICNAALLPYVMAYNGEDKTVQLKFKKIAMALGIKGAEWFPPYRAMLESVAAIKKLSEEVGIPKKLGELGVKCEDFEALAELAVKDTCMPTNPRDADLQDVIGVYRKAFAY